MAALLQIVGFVWAAAGVANIFMRDLGDANATTANGLVIIFNMILFIIPGLLLGAKGHNMQKRDQASKASAKSSAPQDRLAKLEKLHESGLLSGTEYQSKRSEILKDL